MQLLMFSRHNFVELYVSGISSNSLVLRPGNPVAISDQFDSVFLKVQ